MVGRVARLRKDTILSPNKIRKVLGSMSANYNHAEALREPLYLLSLLLPSNTRRVGYEITSCSRQRSASTVQSMLSRAVLVRDVAASHSASRALLDSLESI